MGESEALCCLLEILQESENEGGLFCLFFSPPRSPVHCEVRASSVPLLSLAFINHGFVCRSQEVVKLCQNQVQRQLDKKAPISNFAEV